MPTINSSIIDLLAKQAEEERLAEEALEAEYKKQKKQERSKDSAENTANTPTRRL